MAGLPNRIAFHRSLLFQEDNQWSLGPTILGYQMVPHAFAGVMEQLQYALKTGAAPMLSASDNLKTMALVEAAYRSAQEARAVQLAEFGF